MAQYERIMKLPPEKIPRHVAVILDGNGRWAARQREARSRGHLAGAENVETISDAMIAASEKREEMQEETEAYFASQRAMALQAAEKAQRLLDDVRASYPDEAAGSRFKAFERRLKALLSPNEVDAAERSEILDEISSGLSSEEASEIHTELVFSKEPPLSADGEWDLKEVLETLGLSDD